MPPSRHGRGPAPSPLPRRHLNLTTLPTGEVLATGGVGRHRVQRSHEGGVRGGDVESNGTGQWTTLSSNAIMRDYHGTALLMPDGRVLVAGGSESVGTPNQNNAEIFSPPYLFRGAAAHDRQRAPATDPIRAGIPDSDRRTPAALRRSVCIRLATGHARLRPETRRACGSRLRRDATGLTVTAAQLRRISRRPVTTWCSS